MSIRYIALIAVTTILGLPSLSMADITLTPFRAVYQADFKGLPIRAEGIRQLEALDTGGYRLTSAARSLFAGVEEVSTFSVDETQLVPSRYQYRRSGLGKNSDIDVAFDWQAGTASDVNEPEAETLSLSPGMTDRLLYQYQIRADLTAAIEQQAPWPEMSYQLIDRDRIKEYHFEVTGEEVVSTPAGDFQTVRVTRIRDDKDRITNFWLAKDFDFLLVKLEQIEDENDGFLLLLKEASFDGAPIATSAAD